MKAQLTQVKNQYQKISLKKRITLEPVLVYFENRTCLKIFASTTMDFIFYKSIDLEV